MRWLKEHLKNIFVTGRRATLKTLAHAVAIPLKEYKSILVVAPHPDDEVFGCAGLLAGLSAQNKQTDVLFLTDGAASHKGCCDVQASTVSKMRRQLSVQADQLLGIPKDRLTFLDGADGHLPRKNQAGFEEMSKIIATCIRQKKPMAVFCPHPFEGWADHIAASELTVAAMEQGAPEKRPHLYYYCVWFWYSLSLKKAFSIDWRKARLLDISEQLPLKRKVMNTYINALAPCGNPWVGRLPAEFLRAFDWHKELFFEANIHSLSTSN